MAANSSYKNHLNSLLLQRMKERKERGDVEMDSEEKRKELSVEGTGVVRKIGKNKKSTPVEIEPNESEDELHAVAGALKTTS